MLERNGAEVLSAPPPRRGRLFRKYVVIFVVLVSGALLTSGAVEAYFVYEENQAAVIRLQRERAVAAASTIEQFLAESERLLGWVVLSPSTGAPSTEQRRTEYDRLLQLAPSIEDVSYLDAAGMEQVRVSRPTSGGRPTARGLFPGSLGARSAISGDRIRPGGCARRCCTRAADCAGRARTERRRGRSPPES